MSDGELPSDDPLRDMQRKYRDVRFLCQADFPRDGSFAEKAEIGALRRDYAAIPSAL